ncbi:response regulator [uncultured Gemmiger sp.]|uniref:response regulator n=1 Tax=uncultured Gemmiger sp. TaxID=1623490 RepID=UPI0025F40B5A|nr:response regulator [uncultured Gemmiger sp.]
MVLCDVVMPLMDGIDFVTTVHKLYPALEILVLSGYDKFEYVRRTLLNGASDYILKPTLNPQVLLQSLQNAAQRLPAGLLEEDTSSAVLDYGRILEQYILGLDVFCHNVK